ncbi:MAG: hypothetical protein ACO1G1_08335 [Bacteroidota bacterium]
MKRLMLLATGMFLCLTAVEAQPYKQAGGENNLQLLFAPFGSTPLSLNEGITYRRFLKDGKLAARLSISISSSKSTDVIMQADDTLAFPTTTTVFHAEGGGGYIQLTTGMNPQADLVSKTSGFSFRPGIEKHFEGTDRLSPYIGEIVFSSSKTKFTRDTILPTDYTSPVFYDTTSTTVIVSAPWTTKSLSGSSGSKTFGVNLIAGMDYYFSKNLSLGAEFGFGFYSTKYDDLKSDYLDVKNTWVESVPDANGVSTITAGQTTTTKSNPSMKQGKDSGFGPNVTAKIKLGWLF